MSAWRSIGSLATNWAHSKDSGQTGRMPRLIWVFAGRTVILLVLPWGGSYLSSHWPVHVCIWLQLSQIDCRTRKLLKIKKWVMSQQDLQDAIFPEKTACTSVQCYQSSLSAWWSFGSLAVSIDCTAKALIILVRCAGWSESFAGRTSS